jgi:hypothetical protein
MTELNRLPEDEVTKEIDKKLVTLLSDIIVVVGASQVTNGERTIGEVVEVAGANGAAKIIVENTTLGT